MNITKMGFIRLVYVIGLGSLVIEVDSLVG